MSAPMNQISELLFQKSFAECSAEELRQVTAQFPYFAPAHYMLLKKFDPSTEEYRTQYQKAILYFHDPLSFEFFLNHNDVANHELKEAPTGISMATAQSESNDIIEEEPDDNNTNNPAETSEHEPVLPHTAALAAIDMSAPAEGELSFEAYHTVDYFASQGIKLSQEDVGKDKFGRQLKSFTDWLKVMKRVSPGTAATPQDAKTEDGVASQATHSVAESDIVTESMAEVWAKQGNRRKAADIYRKLSLLYPAKSAYFVAKINDLDV
jgi:hypothetical protein